MSPRVRTRRLLAVGLFALIVGLDVAHILLAHDLHGQPPLTYSSGIEVQDVFAVLLLAVVGLAVTWARPTNPVGWLISLTGLFLAVSIAGSAYGAHDAVFPEHGLPFGRLLLAFSAPAWIPGLFIPVTLLLVRYPTGQIRTRWGRWFDRCTRAGLVLVYVGYALSPEATSDVIEGAEAIIDLPDVPIVWVAGSIVAAALFLTGLCGSIGEAVYRVARGPRAERMALLWVLVLAVLGVAAVYFSPWESVSTIPFNLIMVGVAVGVLRYGALGIEVVVRRVLVYAALTAVVLAVFAAVVTGLASVFPKGPTPQLVAAALVAVGLAPVRDRIQSLVDRVIYGERRDPFAALKRLGTPVAGSGELVPEVLGALARALRVEAVTIDSDGGVPLSYGGRQLGSLVVPPRTGESKLAAADLRLIEAVAPLVAAVVHAEQLNADLDRERERVVAATTAERKRLRQELHDGLGPSLTGVGLGLEAAARNPDPELIGRIHAEVGSALEEVRRIIDDLKPVALDDADLATALRHRIDQLNATGMVDAALDVPASRIGDIPESVASAAYRIVDEALTNVVRHASARHCRLRIDVGDQLGLTITDDGVGPGTGRADGVGLTSMRERAERLGGAFAISAGNPGTIVTARIPLESP